MFDVEAGGKRYDEMNVDGGVMAQAFGGALLLAETPRIKPDTAIDFYLIRNGRIGPEYDAPKRKLGEIGGRSISTMMKIQGESDVLRCWLMAQPSGGNFYYISMPDEFQVELKEPFDPDYMKALFDIGHKQGRNGIPWSRKPPVLQDVDWPPLPSKQSR
jgi:hypothetical protein